VAYEYDVFLSYRRQDPVGSWVGNHFDRELRQWLGQALPNDAKIFRDEVDIRVGTEWPVELERALKASKVIVCVWSPDYFRSNWCLAEWISMRERQKACGKTVVYAVKFSDGLHYPKEAQITQQRDLSRFAFTPAQFRESSRYIEFQEAMRQMTEDLATTVLAAPPWDAGFPIVRPDDAPTAPAPALPRFAA